MDTPVSEIPKTVHVLHIQMLKAHHTQAAEAQLLGQITSWLGLLQPSLHKI